MPNSLEIKVKARIMAKKTKLFAKALISNSLFQFLLITLILLPFAYLNLKGWYELLYVIFGLILFLIFLNKHGEYIIIAFTLFLIAGIYYINVAVMPSTFNNYKVVPITNPLTNFFIFFSFDFMLANIIYMVLNDNGTTYEHEDVKLKKIMDAIAIAKESEDKEDLQNAFHSLDLYNKRKGLIEDKKNDKNGENK